MWIFREGDYRFILLKKDKITEEKRGTIYFYETHILEDVNLYICVLSFSEILFNSILFIVYDINFISISIL